MEVLGLTVTFALYGDLVGINKWISEGDDKKCDKNAKEGAHNACKDEKNGQDLMVADKEDDLQF